MSSLYSLSGFALRMYQGYGTVPSIGRGFCCEFLRHWSTVSHISSLHVWFKPIRILSQK